MELPAEDRVQDFINEYVIEDEWVVVGVPCPILGDYAYTVGLTYLGLPELIILGKSAGSARAFFEDVVKTALDKGEFCHGDLLEVPLEPYMPTRDHAHQMMVLDVEPQQKKRYALQAFRQYDHWDFELQQLVLPDGGGFFPWQRLYENRRIDMASVLGRPPKASRRTR